MPAGWVAAAAAGASLLSANSASDASGKQSAATQKGVDETKREYDASRSDLAPYRTAGQAALTRLQSLLGISTPTAGPGGGAKDYKDWTRSDFVNAYQKLFAERGDPNHSLDSINGELENRIGDLSNPDVRQYFDNIGLYKHGPQDASASTASGGAGGTSSPLLSKFSTSDLENDPVYNNGLKFGLDEGTKALERHAAATGGYDSGAGAKAIARFATDYGSTKAGDAYSRFRDWQDSTFGKLSGIAGMGSGATNVGVSAGSGASSNLSNLYSGLGNAQGASAIAQGNAISGGVTNASNAYYQQQLLSQLSGGGQRTAKPASTGLDE